ncbi:MAG: HAD family hydrolase, partial [Thermomicrobiales bacterium]
MHEVTRRALFGAVAMGLAVERHHMPRMVGAQSLATPVAVSGDPLSSWTDGLVKTRILTFIAESTDPGHPNFVPKSLRIATFDNDGTLWCEYPAPAQAYFALSVARRIAETDLEASRKPIFHEVLDNSLDDVANIDPDQYYPLFDAVNSGTTQQRFIGLCRGWLETAVHPITKRRWIDMVYQPQRELMALLAANGFTIFVVTGTSVDFVRAYAPVIYGIPSWQLIGTSYDYGFETVNGRGQVFVTTEENTVVTDLQKSTSIALQIGLRPVVAVGNSDGDLEMLQYAKGGPTPPLTLLVHHTDADREFAYDRNYEWSPFVSALADASREGFTL